MGLLDPDFWRYRIRRFSQSVNIITRAWEYGCGGKWHLVVDLALPAAGEALLLLVTPSWDEILEEYLHPKLGRNRPRAGKGGNARVVSGPGGKRMRSWGGVVPDVDEMIAAYLPAREYFERRTPGPIERAVWLGIDTLDRVMWHYLIAEVVDRFAYRWASGIMEARFCSKLYRYRLYAEYRNNLATFGHTAILCPPFILIHDRARILIDECTWWKPDANVPTSGIVAIDAYVQGIDYYSLQPEYRTVYVELLVWDLDANVISSVKSLPRRVSKRSAAQFSLTHEYTGRYKFSVRVMIQESAFPAFYARSHVRIAYMAKLA